MEMQMLSEVGVNRHIYPIIQKRGRVFEGEYVKRDKDEIIFSATEESRWNLRCYKFMDYVSSKIRKGFEDFNYNQNRSLGKIKSLSDPRLEKYNLLMRPDLIYSIKEGVNNPKGQNGYLAGPYIYFPNFIIKNIAKDLKWSKADVIEIIKMISNYKFKTKYYFFTAKVYGTRTLKNYKYFYDNFSGVHEPLFNIEFSEDESECIVKFNTGFGICFLHNLYVGGYNLFDKKKLYSLSESVQILYRKKFFQWGRLPKVYLGINNVMDILGTKSVNKTSERLVFHRIISELIEKTEVNLVEKKCENRYELSKGIKEKKKCYSLCDKDNEKQESVPCDIDFGNNMAMF